MTDFSNPTFPSIEEKVPTATSSSPQTTATTYTITPDSQDKKKITHVYRKCNNNNNNSKATTDDFLQPIYTLTTQSRKPHVTLLSTSTTKSFGTATFHKFTNFNTDVQYLDHQPITLRPSLATGYHQFTYPNFQGSGSSRILEWRTNASKTEVELHYSYSKSKSREEEEYNNKNPLARLRNLHAIGRVETELVIERRKTTDKESSIGTQKEEEEEFEGFLVLSAVALGVRSNLLVGSLGDAIGVSVVGTGTGGP